MKAVFSNHQSATPGQGLISISGLDSVNELAGLKFALKRASDHKILGALGWQEAELRLSPLRAEGAADGLLIMVGPQVSDHLDMREHYRLYLSMPDGREFQCSMVVESISYSPLAGGQSLEGGLAPPSLETEVTRAASKPEEPPAAPTQAPRDKAAPGLNPGPASKRKLWLALPLGLILIALAIWQLKPVSDAGPEPKAGGPPAKSVLAVAREHLAGPADPADSLKLAAKYIKKPDGADAAFLLIEDAAQKDLPEAMMMLGEFYDPLTDSLGSIAKDPLVARQWYEKARAAGAAGAAERLSALAAWSTDRAADDQ